MAPISRWTANGAILIWVGRCRSWFWSSSLSWQTLVVPDKPEIMVFAVPTEKGSYNGFDYEAIAISYNNKDLVDSLKICL